MKEVFGVIIFFALALALVWFAPKWWQRYHAAKNTQPSITTIQQKGSATTTPAPDADGQTVADSTAAMSRPVMSDSDSPLVPASAVDIAKINVKVMNGGAPKGSATQTLDMLKTAGYKAATIGNATGDFTGVTIYYLKTENKADAEALRLLLSKKYSNAVTQSVVDPKSEQGSAPIVVMLGK